MKHRCRQCGHVDDQSGVCPICNIPMNILQQDEATEPQEATEEAAPEAPATEAPAAPEAPEAPVTPDPSPAAAPAPDEGGDEAAAPEGDAA